MASRLDVDTEFAQEAVARARYVRMSATKVREVIDLIRGRHVEDARRVLAFTQRGPTSTVAKVLESAIANAEHNHALAADELHVLRAWADEGPTLKRFRPRALGRATRVRKRTCHITLVVGRTEEDIPVIETPAAKKTTAKKTTGPKKTTAKKTTAAKEASSKKTTAKKSAAKKTTAKKTTARKGAEEESE